MSETPAASVYCNAEFSLAPGTRYFCVREPGHDGHHATSTGNPWPNGAAKDADDA